MWRRLIGVPVLLLGMLLFTACQSTERYQDTKESVLEIRENGTIREYLVEDFDKDYYNVEELKTLILNEIRDFSVEWNEQKPLSLDRISQNEEGKLVARFTYANTAVYEAWNLTGLFYGELSKALEDLRYQAILRQNVKVRSLMQQGTGRKVIISDMMYPVYPPFEVEYTNGNIQENDLQGSIRPASDVKDPLIIISK